MVGVTVEPIEGTRAEQPLQWGAIPFLGFNDAPLEERSRLMHAMADAGVDGVVQADHVSFRDGSGVEAIVMMAGLSGLHPTLGLFIGVYLLPLRHPVPVARSVATLAQLAPGRVEFGVGIGGEDRHEVEVCGVDPRTRGRRCDDSLDIVGRLLAGEEVTHHGDFFDIDACRIRPTPRPRVPILVGGRSDAAIRRAGRFADGWIGVWCSPRRLAQAAALCSDAAGEAGRGAITFHHKMQPWVGLADTKEAARGYVAASMQNFYGVPFEAFEKYTPHGTAADVAEGLAPYVEAGARGFNVSLCGPDPDTVIELCGEVKRLLS
jgi:alkanesulfonate monooxygenase SsuD/methylene tetrahydromethanopterin reductase-like flavin-dependent oxidoreductase (luciferase family)